MGNIISQYKKRSERVIFLLLVILTIVFHWSCKKNEAPTAPAYNMADVKYAGKTYHPVQIGNQYWLKENLDVGTMILGTDTAKNNGIMEKYCYNNDTANCTLYGGLYQWNEAMQYDTTPGTRGICPPGWHIPTYDEFQILRTIVGGDGNALKAKGQGTGAGTGTNTSGFSALFSGERGFGGVFCCLGYYTFFWSSSDGDALTANHLELAYNTRTIYPFWELKNYGFSVRCIKD